MNNKINYTSIVSFLFYLIPIFLITGPFLPDLTLSIIALSFIIYTFYKKDYNNYDSYFAKVFLFFSAYILFFSLFSENIKLSLESSLFYIRFGIFSLAILYVLKKNKYLIKNIKNILIFIFFILFFDTLYQLNFEKNIIGFEYINSENFRLTSFFGKDEVLGSYVARIYPFVISLIFLDCYKEKKNINKKLIILFSIISLTTVFLSGERTSFVLILLSFFIIGFSSLKLRKIFIGVIILFSIAMIFLVTSNERIKDRMITTPIKLLGMDSDSKRLVLFSKTYEGHYKIAYNMFKQKPLFGHGTKIFRNFCQKKENFVADEACTTHPHNMYMQLLAETGIFGFLFIFSLFIWAAYQLLKNLLSVTFRNKQIISEHKMSIITFFFITLFPFSPSGNIFGNWMSIIFYLPMGFLLYIYDVDKKNYES
jgi:O-antigen ligase